MIESRVKSSTPCFVICIRLSAARARVFWVVLVEWTSHCGVRRLVLEQRHHRLLVAEHLLWTLGLDPSPPSGRPPLL